MSLEALGIVITLGWLIGWMIGTAIMARMIQRGGK